MKRAWLLAGLVPVLLGLGYVHPFGNPRAEPAKGLGTLLEHAGLPADARSVLVAKCADCHSNETRWPMYARLAPGSWLIERDIVQARAKLNLSAWEEMPAEARDAAIGRIAHEAKSGEMPPPQYRLLHWDARLTPAEVAALGRLGGGAAEGRNGAPGDAGRGKAVFERRCTGCHALDGDREGPRLAGVFGRKAGAVAGFDYSAGLKGSGLVWDEATLERWLSDPDLMVPENKMSFRVAKAQERADLIAYLKELRVGSHKAARD